MRYATPLRLLQMPGTAARSVEARCAEEFGRQVVSKFKATQARGRATRASRDP